MDKILKAFLIQLGDRGTSLSGGQRARLNLARALYYDADIYLLDDPLSAVDPHVAKHIFSEAIQGFLADKVSILITHQLQYVKNANKILLIKDGEQQSFGDYNSMLGACNKMDFTKYLGVETSENQAARARSDSVSQFGSMTSINSETSLPMKGRQSVDQTIIQIDKEAVEAKRNEEEQKTNKRQIIKEVTTLQFSRKVYWTYFKLGMAGWKGLFCPVLLSSFLGAQIIFTYSDYYLSLFTNSEEKRHEENTGGRNVTSWVDNMSRDQNIIIYSVLMAALFALSLLRALLFFKVSRFY